MGSFGPFFDRGLALSHKRKNTISSYYHSLAILKLPGVAVQNFACNKKTSVFPTKKTTANLGKLGINLERSLKQTNTW